jgi:uncharacterized protein YbjT (DUF2867 family)
MLYSILATVNISEIRNIFVLLKDMYMKNSEQTILVTGATGAHGGTGNTVAMGLLEQGFKVRALVRKESKRSDELKTIGAEIVIGDLNDRRTLLTALEGIKTAYFTYPVQKGIIEAAANFASAGAAAGLARIVSMSMGTAYPNSPSHLGRAQWLAEDIFEKSGFQCIHLRIAALFFENLQLLHGEDIQAGMGIRNSFGDTEMNWIAASDAGKLAISALINPERFTTGIAYYPCGNNLYSHHQLAELLSVGLQRKITHQTISQPEWESQLLKDMEHNPVINADMATHISVLGSAIKTVMEQNNLFEQLTLEHPLGIKDWLAIQFEY